MEIMERYLKENYLRAMPCKFLNFWHIFLGIISNKVNYKFSFEVIWSLITQQARVYLYK